MSDLKSIIAKARGLQEAPLAPARFELPLPRERCTCGGDAFVRSGDQDGWACLACLAKEGGKLPTFVEMDRDGWQGGVIGL